MPEELAELDDRFQREIFPVLTPLAVGPGQPFPYISPLSISLGLFVADPESGEERFARVKVPEGLPRFFPVGRRGRFVPLEGVLSHYLPELFPGMEILERSLFRVTRDGDLEVADEADDLLEAVEVQLRRARFGEVTRLEVSESMSQAMREQLQQGLRVPDDLVYPRRRNARPRRSGRAQSARPARSQERPLGAGGAAAVELRSSRRPSSSPRSAQAISSSTIRTTRSRPASSRSSIAQRPIPR